MVYLVTIAIVLLAGLQSIFLLLSGGDTLLQLLAATLAVVFLSVNAVFFKSTFDNERAVLVGSVGAGFCFVERCLFAFYVVVSIYLIYSLYSISESQLLKDNVGVGNRGVVVKFSATLLPALAVVLLLRVRGWFLSLALIVPWVTIVLLFSVKLLSKQALFPLIVGLVYVMYMRWGRRITLMVSAGLLILLVMLLVPIYSLRNGEMVSALDVMNIIFFRVVIVPELMAILDVGAFFKPLFCFNPFQFGEQITVRIFGRDPATIGVAPGYVGAFVANFGPLFPLFILLSTASLVFWLRCALGVDSISLFVYYMISCELFPFLIDGVPHFITSTTKGVFFWSLLVLTVVVSIGKLARRRASVESETAC